jgi:hypothetical protein
MASLKALPVELEELYFHCRELVLAEWPAKLRILHICQEDPDYPTILSLSSLPSQLEELKLNDWQGTLSGAPLKSFVSPSSLRRLILPSAIGEEWPQHLPPHLEYLELPRSVVLPNDAWRKDAQLPPDCILTVSPHRERKTERWTSVRDIDRGEDEEEEQKEEDAH